MDKKDAASTRSTTGKPARKLQGQVAIVTGSGRGLGAAIARRLAQAGAAVVLTARSEEQLDVMAKTIGQAGGRAIGVPADVSDPTQVEEVVESALDQFGRVDILVNNAAVVWPLEEISEADPDEWAYNIHINLVGPFYMARNVLPVMLEQRYGRIINVGSGAGRTPIVGMSAYCAAKAGLEMLTRTLAKELDGRGVTANYFNPGMVDTDMQSDIRSVDTSESMLDYTYWHESYEQQRLADPMTVSRLIYWLCGPWSRGQTGQNFNADDAAWLAQVDKDLK
ncbi:MAG: SDR family oxidoreductase [Caldilineaceae bacterium]|nr:SDR family oxidoreductase [Caldilineaceae bacterium]